MKILFLASYFPKPDNTVMGTWALSQAQALVRQGVDLQVVSFTSALPKWIAYSPGAKAYAHCPADYVWPGSVSVQYPRWLYYPIAPFKQRAYINPHPFLQMAWWSARKRLTEIIRGYQPDILFCHHSLPNGWIAAQLPDRPPLFVLDHDYDEITDCYQYPRRKKAMQQMVKRVEQLLAVSTRLEKDMQQLFPTAPTATLHNGIALPPSSLKDRPRPPQLKQRRIILTCALFAERKGIPLLIKAFHRISTKHPNAILRIIGAGPEEEKIKQTINQLSVHEQVQLLGKVPHKDVLQEMAWSDCFALVGWDEPFATVYLEAMAAGKPILCCSDGGINDVIEDSVHGYTVPPKNIDATAEALDRLLSNDTKRVDMGNRARQLIEHHLTWDAKAAELIQRFETSISTKKQRSIASQSA
ncbi:glycosyltransferase family 4 protein [Leptothoe sp. LEGE 181152]|nr:glycosyltransferase family 4 protein [Leptothoe sp. LEGE 181152]